MNKNIIICYDFETGSRNPLTTQPLQLGAVAIDPRTLTVIEGSTFNTFIKPELNEDKCKELGIDTLQQEALDVNNITIDDLKDAPSLEIVWMNFTKYVEQFKVGKSNWDNPIPCGYNINNFDNKIIYRLCEKFGPFDKNYGTQGIFHPIHHYDVMNDVWRWTESKNFRSISMDSIREWMGIKKDGAHNAIKDVLDTAFLAIKFLKLYRRYVPNIVFENSFKNENDIIDQILKKIKK